MAAPPPTPLGRPLSGVELLAAPDIGTAATPGGFANGGFELGSPGASLDGSIQIYPRPVDNPGYPLFYGAARSFGLIAEEHNGNLSPEGSSANSSSEGSATIAVTTAIVHENRESGDNGSGYSSDNICGSRCNSDNGLRVEVPRSSDNDSRYSSNNGSGAEAPRSSDNGSRVEARYSCDNGSAEEAHRSGDNVSRYSSNNGSRVQAPRSSDNGSRYSSHNGSGVVTGPRSSDNGYGSRYSGANGSSMEAPRSSDNGSRHGGEVTLRARPTRRADRPSWLVDGSARTPHDENLWRRRRKTDPEGGYSYHRDYHEALSSLLWEPYDCRQPTPATPGSLDDADVSLWLYPPGRNQNLNFPYGRDAASSSTSTSSLSSADDAQWRVRPDASSSSLQPLVTPDPLGGFGDLEGGFAAAPVGALPSRCSGCPPRPPPLCDQSECAGRGGNTNMLVSVETIPSDTGGTNTTLVSTSNSVSVVNCYRAVPVVVSAVPTIPCVNSAEQENVSNVHIVQTSAPAVLCHPRGRTFTSTEAQTDDVSATEVSASVNSVNNREQRRRERRERRHQRRVNTTHHNNLNHEAMWTTDVGVAAAPVGERLPDILNSHLPPPYSTLPLGLPPGHMPLGPPGPDVPVPNVCPVPLPVPGQTTVPVPGSPPPPQPGIRFPFQIAPTGRRRSRRTPRGQHYTPEEEPKSCCGVIVTQTVSIRWFIVMIAFVGICCAVVGTVLGAMKASGREHLTVSLLMIGVGIVLITVSGVAWRLTAHDAPSCRVMLGLSRGEEGAAEPNRRFVPRLPPSYGRPHHPYAAMMYPEFQYRPPPPSYQASMQEYRLRLLLLDRHSTPGQTSAISPPPTYRSHSGTLRAPLGLRADPSVQDFSRPPSYRSRTSSTRPTLDPNGNPATSPVHSRDPSMTESCNGSAVNVISVVNEPESLDSIKMCPDQDLPLRMMLEKGSHSGSTVDVGKDGNLVTIVSTGNDSSPVIVTVSGSTMATTTMCGSTSQQCMDTEMEILAHL